jgi:hypothetical protein
VQLNGRSGRAHVSDACGVPLEWLRVARWVSSPGAESDGQSVQVLVDVAVDGLYGLGKCPSGEPMTMLSSSAQVTSEPQSVTGTRS